MSADADRGRPEAEAVLERLRRWYHLPALLAIAAYMLYVRLQPYDEFVRDDRVLFGGNDAYYHYRATMYSVENWPRRLYTDPWTEFPYATTVGHFGTLFDQFFATVALLIGLGDPSARQVAILAVVAPALLGAAAAIPVYYLGKHLSQSRLAGVVAAGTLALIPNRVWMTRTTAGFYDHHAGETVLMTVAVLAMLLALRVAQRDRPVFEQFQDRDWDALRTPLTYGALAGVALAAYLLAWPAGIVLGGIFGIFFVLAACAAVVKGDSPEHVAIVGVTASLTAAVVTLPFVQSLGTQTNTLSLLHIGLLLALTAGLAVLAGLARYWDREDVDPVAYPGAVAALGGLTVLLGWLVAQTVVARIWRQVQNFMFFGATVTAGTISEAQPMSGNLGEAFYQGYGFTFFVAVFAIILLLGRVVTSERPEPEYLLVAVWATLLTTMSVTQVRFHYYLVAAVAVLNGWLVVEVFRLMEFPDVTTPEEFQTYHVLTVVIVVLVIVVPVASPIAVATAQDAANQQRPGGITVWTDDLDFVEQNTPAPGTYGGEGEAMDYYETSPAVDDYAYPEGAYGVMSWWDYGHWITTEGERIPNANPFQRGAEDASAFLQATNETRANQLLAAQPATQSESLADLNDTELQDVVESRTDQEASEETRYVMIDDQTAGGKFSAITQWTGPGYGSYVSTGEREVTRNQTATLQHLNDQYHQTMVSRLYVQDTVGMEHYRLVHESQESSFVFSIAQRTGEDQYRTLMTGVDPRSAEQQVSGIVQAAISPANQRFVAYDVYRTQAVKTFERVDGATITGDAEPGARVTASVTLESDADRQFEYRQSAVAGEDGQFELTVPYATDDQLGTDDGYTDAAVEANGTYTVTAQSPGGPTEQASDVAVPEPAIYDGEEIGVDLETVEQPDANGTDGGADGEAAGSDDGAGTDAESSGNETAASAVTATAGW